MVATGFDSEYYKDDPRAQEALKSDTTAAPAAEPEAEKEDEKAEEEIKPESKSSDFADATTVNMWDNIRSNTDDDDSDIPAILRRRKKNKD